jgi:RNA recognition motif-containing protein
MDSKEISVEQKSYALGVKIFTPASERRQNFKDLFNNIFVKNFPTENYSSEDLRKVFEPYGPIISCKVDDSGAFGFVSFEKCEHAAKALDSLSEAETGLYIAKAMKKDVRKKVLRIEMLKTMK